MSVKAQMSKLKIQKLMRGENLKQLYKKKYFFRKTHIYKNKIIYNICAIPLYVINILDLNSLIVT